MRHIPELRKTIIGTYLNNLLVGDNDPDLVVLNEASFQVTRCEHPHQKYKDGYCITLESINGNLTEEEKIKLRGIDIIGFKAFRGRQFKEIDLGDVFFVDTEAFFYCSSTTSIKGENLRHIGESAFANCHELKVLELPKARTCDANIILHCSMLEILKLPSFIQVPSDIASQFSSYQHHKDSWPIIDIRSVEYLPSFIFKNSYIGELIVPSLKYVGDSAIYNTEIQKLIIRKEIEPFIGYGVHNSTIHEIKYV